MRPGRLGIRLSRLRYGEVLAGIAGLVLIVVTFVPSWYGTQPPCSQTDRLLRACKSFTAWQALPLTRWLLLLTGLTAIALMYFQAARRSPAVPTSLSAVVMAIGLLSLLAVIYRLASVPSPAALHARNYGAYLGLASVLVVLVGAFLSMRIEGIEETDGPGEIPTVRLWPGEAGS